MAGLLGNGAHLVSYGAMSKQPLSLPTSLFLFKNLTAHGFWQSRWNQDSSQVEKENVLRQLVELITQGKVSIRSVNVSVLWPSSPEKLKEPKHEILFISAQDTDEQAGEKVRDVIRKLSGGHYGKKVLLKLETLD
jgi:mitochondrial enoyl-[acyl-carrier protein] reductase / trans-2-enoyl-CoA reductase